MGLSLIFSPEKGNVAYIFTTERLRLTIGDSDSIKTHFTYSLLFTPWKITQ